MDRLKQLESYSIRELVDELMRRKGELDSALAVLGVSSGGQEMKYSRKSAAKAEYWAEWHAYKAAKPDATVEQWRRSQKRSSKK